MDATGQDERHATYLLVAAEFGALEYQVAALLVQQKHPIPMQKLPPL